MVETNEKVVEFIQTSAVLKVGRSPWCHSGTFLGHPVSSLPGVLSIPTWNLRGSGPASQGYRLDSNPNPASSEL